MIELLSPAGSFESLEAAVRSGADAVYFGLPEFNARRRADNFTTEQFIEAVNYCHVRNVKSNITFNTLVSDDEMGDVKKSIEIIAKSGADAVIVQDLGIAKIIKESCPSISLHASTQMSVHSPSALFKLKEMGFDRVVLARELSESEIEQITRVAKQIGIETEVFVHGAHCMCLSGQCYFSGMIGQRSGNRGLCAQPCRMNFDNGYPLSLKDMMLLPYVKRLEDMGVTSVKIEGRMKRPEYIAVATKAYRNAIDGITDINIEENLQKVFSRSGHTDGYFTSKLGSQMFGIRSKEDVLDTSKVLKEIHSIYRNELQKIPVNIKLTLKVGHQAEIDIDDGENFANVKGDIVSQAESKPMTLQKAEDSVSKLGGTPFFVNNIEAVVEDNAFITSSALNSLRRDAVDFLLHLRSAKQKECFIEIKKEERKGPTNPKVFTRFSNVKQIPQDLCSIDRIYLPLNCSMPSVKTELGVEIPRAMFEGEDIIFSRLLTAKNNGAEYALCHNLSAVELAKKAGLKLHAGFGINVFNSQSIKELGDIDDITLSFELTFEQIKSASRGGAVVYGKMPLMITRNCPKGGKRNCDKCNHKLIDRMGYEFPIICTPFYSEILNSKATLIKENFSGLDFVELYFTTESKAEVQNVIDYYINDKTIKGDFTYGLYRRGVY